MENMGNYTKDNFNKHHEENPNIYKLFCKFALKAASVRDFYSAKIIFHRIRWETDIAENDSSFKVSDGWISHYSRKFMKDYPEHEGFFRTTNRRNTYHD
jgi:hypothetical protein